MKLWWDPCSCLKTWCRTSGEGGDNHMEKWEGWMWVRVCGCICAVHPVSPPPPPVLSSCGQDIGWIPHNDLYEGTGLGCSLVLLTSFDTQHKVTDVTDMDFNTFVSVLSWRHEDWPVKDKAAHPLWGCSWPAKGNVLKKLIVLFSFLPRSSWGLFIFLLFFFFIVFLPKYDCMLVLFPIFLTDLTISKSILVSHPSCGWQIWDTANVVRWFHWCGDPCKFVLAWMSLVCWVCVMLVCPKLTVQVK